MEHQETQGFFHQHITYHPLDVERARFYACATLDARGGDLAASYCKQQQLDEATTDRLLDLLPHFALQPGEFDQVHGFHAAVMHGYFDTYFYIDAAPLSSLGHLLDPYVDGWQSILPQSDAAASASNQITGSKSSGVFLRADKIARFMSDTHEVPELSAALAATFPGAKAHVLWAALQRALATNSGLLEASGVLALDPASPEASKCYSDPGNCDEISLQALRGQLPVQQPAPIAAAPTAEPAPQPAPVAAAPTPPATQPAPTHAAPTPPAPQPAPTHAAPTPPAPQPAPTHAAAHQPEVPGHQRKAGGLAERLQAKRLAPVVTDNEPMAVATAS